METLDYMVQVAIGTMALFSAWVMHKLKQKEARFSSVETRMSTVEKTIAVNETKLTNIDDRLQDVQGTLNILVSKLMK